MTAHMITPNQIPVELLADSLSPEEIVLRYPSILAVVQRLPELGMRVLGWEGWLRYPDGRRGHSARQQGTSDLSKVSAEEAAEFCIRTIREAHNEATKNPEAGELYFCVTVSKC